MKQALPKSVLALLLAAVAVSACAQNARCPDTVQDLPPEALYGRWEARFDGLPGVAAVQLARHPEYQGVRGTIARPAATGQPAAVAQLAGDIGDDGTLAIDESLDGKSISGVWVGAMAPGGCGREFRGTWRDATDESTHPFVLTKKEGTGK